MNTYDKASRQLYKLGYTEKPLVGVGFIRPEKKHLDGLDKSSPYKPEGSGLAFNIAKATNQAKIGFFSKLT